MFHLFKPSKYFKLLSAVRGTSFGQSFQELNLCWVLCVTELQIRPNLRCLCVLVVHIPITVHEQPYSVLAVELGE